MKKKRSEETQTLRNGCSKVEPNFFALLQTPFPGAQDGQNLISWRWSLPIPTNPVWWELMHTISSYRGNRPVHPHTHPPTQPQTNRQDRLQYTAPQLARSVTKATASDINILWLIPLVRLTLQHIISVIGNTQTWLNPSIPYHTIPYHTNLA